jgi:hypothetical protein
MRSLPTPFRSLSHSLLSVGRGHTRLSDFGQGRHLVASEVQFHHEEGQVIQPIQGVIPHEQKRPPGPHGQVLCSLHHWSYHCPASPYPFLLILNLKSGKPTTGAEQQHLVSGAMDHRCIGTSQLCQWKNCLNVHQGCVHCLIALPSPTWPQGGRHSEETWGPLRTLILLSLRGCGLCILTNLISTSFKRSWEGVDVRGEIRLPVAPRHSSALHCPLLEQLQC